ALCLSFDRRRFAAAGIARRLDEYRELLERLAANPAHRLDALVAPGAAATPRSSVEVREAQAPPAAAPAIHGLVAEQAPRAHRALRDRLPGDVAARALYLDSDVRPGADEPADPPAVRVLADNLAYVIHTSGSTGTPKGVQISHRALMAHGAALVRRYGLTAD